MIPLVHDGLALLVRWTSRVAFSRVEVRGMERVPWDQPCIVSPNHPNALLDALLVGAFVPTRLRFLSRADVFDTPFAPVLRALGMAPVYRRRDGFGAIARNQDIFAEERRRLVDGGSLLVFSEAEHAHTYVLRPLSKGSARIALDTQTATERDVMLVPVGLTYYHLTRPGFKVSLVVGDPIPVRDYLPRYREDAPRALHALRADLAASMRACLLIPNETNDYSERVDRLHRKTEDLSFSAMRRALQAPDALEPKDAPRPGLERLARWISLLNVGPLWLTTALMRWVDDPVFALSLKFVVGMIGVPLWWGLLFAAGTAVAGWTAGTALVLLSMLTLALRLVLVRHANPPHTNSASSVRCGGM
jgi:1-acyl-sn-glycerol-3-phosphate acyltransferase